MELRDFKRIARLLKRIYAEIEKEALERGVDISSVEYEEFFEAAQTEARKKILTDRGFTVEEYTQAKEENDAVPKQRLATVVAETNASLETLDKKITEVAKIAERPIPTQAEIEKIAFEIVSKNLKAPEVKIVNQIVEKTIVEKPTIVKETITETVNVPFDDSPIVAELGFLNDKVDKIPTVDTEKLKEEIRGEFQYDLQKNINTLGMPDFRKLGMGLQQQIDELRTAPSTGTETDPVFTASEAASFVAGDKSKLDGIAAGAEVNVNADWSASSGDAQILNKPTLGGAAGLNVGTTVGTVAAGDHNHTGVYEPAKGTDDNFVTDAQLIVIGNTSGTNTGDNATNSQYSGLAAAKQDVLVSATNIKTVNGTTLLGSGDLVVGGGAPEGTAVLSTGETGGSKYLREDGDGTCSWQTISGSGLTALQVYSLASIRF